LLLNERLKSHHKTVRMSFHLQSLDRHARNLLRMVGMRGMRASMHGKMNDAIVFSILAWRLSDRWGQTQWFAHHQLCRGHLGLLKSM